MINITRTLVLSKVSVPTGEAQPETIGEAKTRIQETEIASWERLKEGYRTEECRSEYGDTKQQWRVVHSDEAE